MERSQEHIATLCAVGTVGIAAAGLALGTSDGDSYLIKPGKRKAPGSSAATRSPVSPELPFQTRSSPVQPATSTPALTDRLERRLSTSLLRRKIVRSTTPTAGTESTGIESRESSISRHGILRPWTSDRESSTERKDQRSSSTWLRRISSLSRPTRDSPASSSSRLDGSPAPPQPSGSDLDQPNKLVKRSSSRRILSTGPSPPGLLRRPATSHQRSVTLTGVPYTRPLTTESAVVVEHPGYVFQGPTWRPFFSSTYARKKHSAGMTREPVARTVSTPYRGPATLLLGGLVEPHEAADMEDRTSHTPDPPLAPPARRHKIRRTFGSVRKGLPQRHFTDPIVRVNKDEAYGDIVPSTAFSNLSPMSNISAFEVELPPGTPIFNSSPPSFGPPQHRFAIPKRISAVASDPTTASSDNDTRVFTDDDSMDFHSDTAYDSLATRATASSHSGFRQPKIETIFDEMAVDGQLTETTGIEDLMQHTTLNEVPSHSDQSGHGQATQIGIGISGIGPDKPARGLSPDQATTPVKNSLREAEDSVSTPVPAKKPRHYSELTSSPLFHPFSQAEHQEPELPQMMDIDDRDEIDWSPKVMDDGAAKNVPFTPAQIRFDQLSDDEFDEQRSTKRSSIFDWSEHQKFGNDQSNGISPRPKTVHGKQSNHVGRSRASGRKSNAAIHLRSQSVPVNRDGTTENDLPPSTTKFGTWALGSKPVSEEWSDDFEFDDVDESDKGVGANDEELTRNRESVPSVRVPQSIMDRQQSVHIQFGQVRDFMLLVEELKRLRTRGGELGLLESHSRQLWEDAESIIDLATINDEDDALPRPSSPTSSDIFGDETSPPNRKAEEGPVRTINRRSISSPGTPPYGRPRGESLQTKTFLQTIHQNRGAADCVLPEIVTPVRDRDKLPFDTQDLRDLVVRAGVITRALKDLVRKAEGVSLSPERPVAKFPEPVFRQIFEPPDSSPSPGLRKPGLPKSRSANSYLDGTGTSNDRDVAQTLNFTKVVEAN